ncbi:hypothetical protein [Shinella sp.]|uniref:hypothetical protein n=1 Tax=Shinella sp. TaxID=1870904 RepID=UPI0040370961
MSDWKQRAIAGSTVLPDWKRRAIEGSDIFGTVTGPDATNIDDSAEAPAMVRMAVGALDKDEDRLNALRKFFPDAVPNGDQNFIYTNPETGRTNKYNQEGWIPSFSDFASIVPEAAETVGGIGGAAVGGVGGAIAGSAVPVVGTATGGVGGAVAGAGVGAAGARDLTQRGLNWWFGNEDTRTNGEYLRDTGTNIAMGAAGEGAGRLIGHGLKAGKNAWNRRIIGEMDETPEIAARAADYRAIGVEPTVGMATGSDRAAKLEHALIPTRSGHVIEDRIQQAFQAQDNEFSRIIGGLTDQPKSIAEAGEALRDQAELAKKAGFARSNDLYAKAGEKIASPAVVDSTTGFLQKLEADRAGFGEFDKLTRGSQTDQIIEQAKAIVADAQNGVSFDTIKGFRTDIGKRAAGETDAVMKRHLDGLYRSLSDDMQNTALASGPDARQAFNKANNHYRRLVDEETGFGKGSVADKIVSAADTDKIFNWATANAKNGGNRIAQSRRLVEKSEGGKEAWNGVIGGYVDRLGRNSADDFDPGTFMRNWNKTSKEAKDAMFKGTANAQYRADLDRLSGIAENFTKYRKNANHSNTQAHRSSLDSVDPLSKDNVLGTALGTATIMASGGTAVGGLAVGAATGAAKSASRGIARASRVKLLTDPATVNWLANIGQAEMRKGGIKQHMKNLVTLRNRSGNQALAVAIDEFLIDLGYDENQ